MLPSAESETEKPRRAAAMAVSANLEPCCIQLPSDRTNTHAAPAYAVSPGAPISAVLPFADRATDQPCWDAPEEPIPTNLLTSDQCMPERVNIQAAPWALSSPGPPTSAVLPSADRATENPNCGRPLASVGVSLTRWDQPLLERVNTQPAPAVSPSVGPPTSAVLPSDDTATELPCDAGPTAPLPTNFGPS